MYELIRMMSFVQFGLTQLNDGFKLLPVLIGLFAISQIVQDVMIRVWKSIDRYEHGRNNARFSTWLHTITRNCVLSFVDKKRRSLPTADGDSCLAYLNVIAVNELDHIADKEWKIFLTNLALERISSSFRGQAIDAFKAGMRGESKPLA